MVWFLLFWLELKQTVFLTLGVVGEFVWGIVGPPLCLSIKNPYG